MGSLDRLFAGPSDPPGKSKHTASIFGGIRRYSTKLYQECRLLTPCLLATGLGDEGWLLLCETLKFISLFLHPLDIISIWLDAGISKQLSLLVIASSIVVLMERLIPVAFYSDIFCVTQNISIFGKPNSLCFFYYQIFSSHFPILIFSGKCYNNFCQFLKIKKKIIIGFSL